MMYEVLDDTAGRVLLATESGDSIRHMSQRLQEPYETVRQAVNRLEDAGFIRYDDGLSVVDDEVRSVMRELVAASATRNPPSIEQAYVLPHFGDWPFAFSRIDAVYVWTRGGYQVGRNPNDYPLFLAVEDANLASWEEFFSSFGLPTAQERQAVETIAGPLQIVLDSRQHLASEEVEGYPVIPRAETIAYMQEHAVQFRSALSMMDRMYDDLDLRIAYRESDRVES